MSKLQLVNELHTPARKNFKRRHVITKGIDYLWQADLVDMSSYSNVNKGHNFLLTVIDTFSKFAWAISIKTKSGIDVTNAMLTIFNTYERTPQYLQTDDGKEFFNKHFQTLMNEHTINHYSTFSVLKASICERWNRTLKNMMWKMFSLNGSYHWISKVKSLVDKYNNTYHRTIKMKPVDVNSPLKERQLLSSVYNYILKPVLSKFKVGDSVRISKYKHIFEKSYTPNFTTEVFKVRRVQKTDPVTYLLKDYKDNPIKGGFYELELIKAKYPNLYLVEKILRKKGNQVLVKWLGFKSSESTWENKTDIL